MALIGIEEGETMVRMYCMREESIFNNKNVISSDSSLNECSKPDNKDSYFLVVFTATEFHVAYYIASDDLKFLILLSASLVY